MEDLTEVELPAGQIVPARIKLGWDMDQQRFKDGDPHWQDVLRRWHKKNAVEMALEALKLCEERSKEPEPSFHDQEGAWGIFAETWGGRGIYNNKEAMTEAWEKLYGPLPADVEQRVKDYLEDRERRWYDYQAADRRYAKGGDVVDPSNTTTLEAIGRRLRKLLDEARNWEAGRLERYPEGWKPDNLRANVVSGHTSEGFANIYIQGLGGPPWKRVRVWAYMHEPGWNQSLKTRRLSPDEEARLCRALKAEYPRVLWDEKGAHPEATTIEWEEDGMKVEFNLDWRARGPDGREGTILNLSYGGPGVGYTNVTLLMPGPDPNTLVVAAYPSKLVTVVRGNGKLTAEEKSLKEARRIADLQGYLKSLTPDYRAEFLKRAPADYQTAWKLVEEGKEIKVIHEVYKWKEVTEVEWNRTETRADLDVLKARLQDAAELVEQIWSRPGVPRDILEKVYDAKKELSLARQHIGLAGLAVQLVEGLPVTPPGTPAEATAKAEKPEPAQAVAPGATARPRVFYLEDGRGPFESVQSALDGMGIPKDKRPNHNRWERLSAAWKKAIIPREKGGQNEGAEETAPGSSES